MCQRITRQSNAAKAGGRRGRRDAIDTIETSPDVKQEGVLMEDEMEIREGRNYHHHREQLDKQLASQLRIKVMMIKIMSIMMLKIRIVMIKIMRAIQRKTQ